MGPNLERFYDIIFDIESYAKELSVDDLFEFIKEEYSEQFTGESEDGIWGIALHKKEDKGLGWDMISVTHQQGWRDSVLITSYSFNYKEKKENE